MTRATAACALGALSAALALAAPASAGDRSAQAAVETALAAMDRGYGAACSLANKPVPSGGYWPCVDIGPYRFVKEYGRVRAFVVVKDGDPYPIMVSTDGDAEFTVGGRWSQDMPRRVAAWWEDEVLRARQRRDAASGEDGRHAAADEAIRGFDGPPSDAGPASAAPTGAEAPRRPRPHRRREACATARSRRARPPAADPQGDSEGAGSASRKACASSTDQASASAATVPSGSTRLRRT